MTLLYLGKIRSKNQVRLAEVCFVICVHIPLGIFAFLLKDIRTTMAPCQANTIEMKIPPYSVLSLIVEFSNQLNNLFFENGHIRFLPD